MTWTKETQLSDGHRMFFTDNMRKVAIADDSGRYPADTDDGVLWLDFDRPLELGPDIAIPVMGDGGPRWTASNPQTIICLSVEFEWVVESGDKIYRVKEV